jgi:predicted enzyme related to lactoylglutathione lyase
MLRCRRRERRTLRLSGDTIMIEQAVLNALSWFEIPSVDIARAARFYGAIFEKPFGVDDFRGEPVMVFSYAGGVGGAVVQRRGFTPAAHGTLVYLDANGRLDETVALVPEHGGTVVVPITALPRDMGRYAVIRDSEGNHIGLHASH